jgi:hypothetical protein
VPKARWWKWKRRPGTVPEGDYEVAHGWYGFELEVIDPEEEVYSEHSPRRQIRLVTSQEVFDSWTEDEDALNRALLERASRVYGRPLQWADHMWHWDRYAKVRTIPLSER